MRVLIFMWVMVGACWGEVNCFHTVAQAAVQVGEQEGGGYRLEFVRLDRVGGKSWATVRSCAHPEWPGVVVARAEDGRAAAETTPLPVKLDKVSQPDVVVGRRVKVVRVEAMARMEMTGVAQGIGWIGDRVWVRVLGPGGEGEGRMELAVVRSADLLEAGR